MCEIRGLRPEEYAQAENMMSLCFRFDNYQEPVNDTGHKHEDIYGAFNEAGEMTSCVVGNRYQAYYWGHRVGMCGVGGVCTLPEYRRGGGVRKVLTLTLEQAYDRGDVIASLYPFSHRFYRKFGFESGAAKEICTIHTGGLDGFAVSGRVRRYHPGTEADRCLIKQLYETFAARHNYAIVRSEELWKEHIEKDPYRTHIYTYIWENERGEAEGYLTVVHDQLPDDRGFTVKEWAYTTPAAMRGLLGFLKQLSPSGSKRTILPCCGDVPAAQLFPESVLVSTVSQPQGMVRLVNVYKALSLYPWEEGTDLYIQVDDSILVRNAGIYHVQSRFGETAVEMLPDDGRQNIETDIVCSIQTLSLLLSGIMDLQTARISREELYVCEEKGRTLPAFAKRPMYLWEEF